MGEHAIFMMPCFSAWVLLRTVHVSTVLSVSAGHQGVDEHEVDVHAVPGAVRHRGMSYARAGDQG